MMLFIVCSPPLVKSVSSESFCSVDDHLACGESALRSTLKRSPRVYSVYIAESYRGDSFVNAYFTHHRAAWTIVAKSKENPDLIIADEVMVMSGSNSMVSFWPLAS